MTHPFSTNPRQVIESVWMHRYTVQEGAEWIGSISIVWAETFPGMPAKLIIWSDPDGDGNPSDAQVLHAKEIRTRNVGEMIWNHESIAPTYIGPAGTSFFVGAYYDAVYGSTPIAIDASSGNNGNWVAFALEPAVLDLNALATEQVGAGFFEMSNVNFFLRAEGFDGTLTEDCDGNGLPDSCQEDSALCDE